MVQDRGQCRIGIWQLLSFIWLASVFEILAYAHAGPSVNDSQELVKLLPLLGNVLTRFILWLVAEFKLSSGVRLQVALSSELIITSLVRLVQCTTLE